MPGLYLCTPDVHFFYIRLFIDFLIKSIGSLKAVNTIDKKNPTKSLTRLNTFEVNLG